MTLESSPYGRPTRPLKWAFLFQGAPRARDHSRSESNIVFGCLRILRRPDEYSVAILWAQDRLRLRFFWGQAMRCIYEVYPRESVVGLAKKAESGWKRVCTCSCRVNLGPKRIVVRKSGISTQVRGELREWRLCRHEAACMRQVRRVPGNRSPTAKAEGRSENLKIIG